MTSVEFKASMERVLAFYSSPHNAEERGDFERYMSALYEAVGNWSGIEFEQVTRQLIAELSPIKKPMPAQFFVIQARIRAERRRDSGTSQSCEESSDAKRAWLILEASRATPRQANATLALIEQHKSLVPNFPSNALLMLMDRAAITADEERGAVRENRGVLIP